ncbi:helix-turn-helix domain-containing protein [Thalassobius vesicularis]|uniref:helix-turn-helix domain-containing protein n=1 Tax=Thalassobius vesicularis TaxID=1294297 RepID=UPI0024824684|nr:helix-turn-helix domain-containing protein [Thalassobius vesicularis]
MSGDCLRSLRHSHGLSRSSLARLAGLHPDTVKYWERKPTVRPFAYGPRLILAALGIQVAPRFGLGVFRNTTRARDGVLATTSRPQTKHLCGAKTRKGAPCQAKAMPGRKRCKFHGGASTGPRTQEGRRRISEAQKLRWALRTASKNLDL